MTEIAERSSSAGRRGATELAVGLVALAWIALATLWAAPGVFTVDGFTYRAMIDAFARQGSLFVENGMAAYDSEALTLYFLREVDGRLAPQYPGGWGCGPCLSGRRRARRHPDERRGRGADPAADLAGGAGAVRGSPARTRR